MAVDTHPAGRRRAVRRTTLVRVAVPAAYGVVATTVFATRGIPLERGLLTVWILGALLSLSIGNLAGFGRSVVFEWIPLLAALTAYDELRGVGGGRFPIYHGFQIWIDRDVFGFGNVPSVWLQQQLWDPGRTSAIDIAAWATYMSFFLVTPVLLGTLWLLDRSAFRSYARRLTLLSFLAVAFFTVAPTMPPWLASAKGLIGPSDRLIGEIGRRFPWFDGSTLWERGLHLGNDLAAFPSLHEGMTVLVAVALWRRVPRGVRPILAAYPLAMAFALVYTGEHYVTDLIAGALCTVVVCLVEPRLTEALVRLAGRRQAEAAADFGRRPRRAAG
jgi:PAP2 superfamily protein